MILVAGVNTIRCIVVLGGVGPSDVDDTEDNHVTRITIRCIVTLGEVGPLDVDDTKDNHVTRNMRGANNSYYLSCKKSSKAGQ